MRVSKPQSLNSLDPLSRQDLEIGLFLLFVSSVNMVELHLRSTYEHLQTRWQLQNEEPLQILQLIYLQTSISYLSNKIHHPHHQRRCPRLQRYSLLNSTPRNLRRRPCFRIPRSPIHRNRQRPRTWQNVRSPFDRNASSMGESTPSDHCSFTRCFNALVSSTQGWKGVEEDVRSSMTQSTLTLIPPITSVLGRVQLMLSNPE